MKSKMIKLIKFIAFFVAFVLLLWNVSGVLKAVDTMNYQNIQNFYEEPENSLDAVYIGSSNCFVFWNSLLAWGEYGISVYPYAGNAFSYFASEYYIKEARRTQPDALYIVNINSLSDGELNTQQMRSTIDAIPFSFDKLAMIRHLNDVADFSMKESMEFYLPLIRFHTRWEEITSYDFSTELNGRKGASIFNQYLETVTDVSADYITTDDEVELSDAIVSTTESLLDYCDKENVNVLFVTVPQAKFNEYNIGRYNALNALIESRGYKVLDLLSDPSIMGIDPTTDFYNSAHTNIHGSAKLTYYLSEYLIENYGFEDKRENPDYSSWNTAYDGYMEHITPHILDIELDANNRADDLAAPTPLAWRDGAQIKLDWEDVENAQGYKIYKKSASQPSWKEISVTEESFFDDTEFVEGELYHYTVLPYYEADGKQLYGDYAYKGVSIQLQVTQ